MEKKKTQCQRKEGFEPSKICNQIFCFKTKKQEELNDIISCDNFQSKFLLK